MTNISAPCRAPLTRWLLLALCLLVGPVARPAFADAVLDLGSLHLGVFDYGNLGPQVGIALDGVGDAISPGCFCEGWGVAVTGSGVEAGSDGVGGVNGLALDSFSSSGGHAVSTVHLSGLSNLQISQDYSAAYTSGSGGGLFKNVVTLSNTGNSDLSSVLYRRVMDWDVAPDQFNEYVTIGGTTPALASGTLFHTSNNGFATPLILSDPADPIYPDCPVNSDFVDCGPGDQGGVFDLNFGTLGANQSKTFTIFYGATRNESTAFAALAAVGAEVYSLAQWSGDPALGTPGTFIWAFAGVGGQPIGATVPEPATWISLGTGLVGVWAARRRRDA